MIVEIYTVVALLCDKRGTCYERTVWTGRDRLQCMAEAVQVRVNPPAYADSTKMSACLVERTRPGYVWDTGQWRKVRQ